MDKVACVKQLYEKLDMKAIFHEYEESSFARLMSLVNEQAGSLPKEIFLELAHHVYKRQKWPGCKEQCRVGVKAGDEI